MIRGFVFAICLAIFMSVGVLSTRADVAFLVVMKVSEVNQSAFNTIATKMTEISKRDKGLLIYEFARVGEHVYGYERYADDEAHERHQSLIKPFLPELRKIAKFEAIITLTPVSEKIRLELEAIGAKIGKPIAGAAQGMLGEESDHER